MESHWRRLVRDEVDIADLVTKRRVSKPLSEYRQRTLSVAALQRAKRHELDKQPGEDIRFVVVDDDAGRMAERVRLAFEDVEEVAVDYYTERLLRATESIVSPMGWKRADIDRYRRNRVEGTLTMY